MSESALSPFQRECIELFVRGAAVFSLPKSIGEIYGLLFSTDHPLPLDEIVDRLKISKGSASQGLRWLRNMGATKTVYVEGDRRDHFVAETELRRLTSGFLREQIKPHLDSGQERLTRLESRVFNKTGEQCQFETVRLKKLQTWFKFSRVVVPMLQRLTKTF